MGSPKDRVPAHRRSLRSRRQPKRIDDAADPTLFQQAQRARSEADENWTGLTNAIEGNDAMLTKLVEKIHQSGVSALQPGEIGRWFLQLPPEVRTWAAMLAQVGVGELLANLASRQYETEH